MLAIGKVGTGVMWDVCVCCWSKPTSRKGEMVGNDVVLSVLSLSCVMCGRNVGNGVFMWDGCCWSKLKGEMVGNGGNGVVLSACVKQRKKTDRKGGNGVGNGM